MHRHRGGAAKAPLCFTAVVCVHIPSCNAGSPLALVCPCQLGCPRVPAFFFFSHTAPFLQTPPRKRTVEVCDAKRVARYLPLARLVEAFGRTTATSACAIATKRQARTHPPTNPPAHLTRLPPSSLPPVCAAPPPCTCGNHFSNY